MGTITDESYVAIIPVPNLEGVPINVCLGVKQTSQFTPDELAQMVRGSLKNMTFLGQRDPASEDSILARIVDDMKANPMYRDVQLVRTAEGANINCTVQIPVNYIEITINLPRPEEP